MSESLDPGGRLPDTVDEAGLADRLSPSVPTDAVESVVPLLDYDALGMRTLIVRLRAHEDHVAAVAAGLRGPETTEVYETTGAYNVIAIGRFRDAARLDAFLGRLATDDRVRTVTATVALRTACEYDHLPLFGE